jgi:hypothetical protein
MFEAKFLQVEAVYEGVYEPYRVFFVDVFFERVWKEGCLFSVESLYVFAHVLSVALVLV